MLPALSIGIFFEKFLIKFSSFFEKPVVPITTLFFNFEAILSISNVHLGIVKSIITFDFLNAERVKLNLVAKETKTVDNITFNIEREIKDGFIFKHIAFFADGKNHAYTEKVKYLDIDKMTDYFKTAGFTITDTFGDYHLNSYNAPTSDRLILVAKK